MERRIFGIETEYGLTCTAQGRRRLSPDEVARHMFRGIVAWGRSSNVFLPNGSRLYLDVGSHPEYATAECDTLADLLAQDRAGTALMNGLVDEAQHRLAAADLHGDVYLFKNNVDSVGNSYGCHENYLVARSDDLGALTDALVPFLITRQILCGAGRLVRDAAGRVEYCISQRADVMWEASSSATTRSRPMINTRDEPHADAEAYRRLHVIVGDSNMCESSTLLKVGTTDLVLRLIEAGERCPDLALAHPSRAIRAISHDPSCRVEVALADGRTANAVQLQRAYHERVSALVERAGEGAAHDRAVLDLWDRVLTALEGGRPQDVAREVDWIAKQRLLEGYARRHGLEWGDPRLAQLDLTYHDTAEHRGVFALMEARAGATRLTTPDEVTRAMNEPPATTRAALRGAFVTAARDAGREYTVDWTHLRLGEPAARTVVCKDPFAAHDPRVDDLIEMTRTRSGAP